MVKNTNVNRYPFLHNHLPEFNRADMCFYPRMQISHFDENSQEHVFPAPAILRIKSWQERQVDMLRQMLKARHPRQTMSWNGIV